MTVALLRAAAAAHPHRTGLVWAPPGAGPVAWTFAEWLAAAERVARRLAGIPPGRAIAVQAAASDAWVIVQHGIALAGLALVAIPPGLPRRPAATMIRQAGAALVLDADAVHALVAAEADPRPLPDVPAGAIAQVQLTSGSGLAPRGVVLTHACLGERATALADALALSPADAVLNPNPLCHVSGQFFALAALARNATHVVAPYDPMHLLGLLASGRGSVLGLPPALLAPLLDARPRPLGMLRLVMVGGMPVAPEFLARGERLWGVPLRQAYGLTEAGGLTHLARASDPRDTVGRPLAGVETRIAARAPSGEGEVQVRLASPMTGYLGDPAATAGAFAPGGWLRTGDLGRLDDDGCLTITGRLSERIIRAGATISPLAVEAALIEHPLVAEAAAVGLPHPRDHEHVAAQVVPAPGTAPGEAALRAHCAALLPPSAVPDRIELVHALPRTPLGKLRRAAVRRRMLT